MSQLSLVLASVVVLSACERRKAPGAGSLPAESWNSGEQAAGEQDPHAGVDMNDPHAGVDMSGGGGGDPHAGIDMSGGDPHAGMDLGSHGGANPHGQPGVQADPSQFVTGTLELADPKLPVPAQGVLYLIARQKTDDPKAKGAVLAVIDSDIPSLPYQFRVDQSMSKMPPSAAMTGEVVIKARVDSDGDADTTSPGDLIGQVVTKVPAEGVVIKLEAAQ